MKIQTDTLKGKLAILALVGEALLGIGCTWIILNHYYSLTSGATILSSAGVLLTLVMACAGLHFLIAGETAVFKSVAAFVWIALTLVEAVLATTIWMSTQHGKTQHDTRAAITQKQEQLRTTRDKEVRKEIQADIAELRASSTKEVFKESQVELKWLYETGVHSLPFPCGFAGMILLIVCGVIQSKEEDESKKEKPSPKSAPALQPRVGFNPPQTVTARKDPKGSGHPWI
jgi:hypothetical protein